MDTLRQETKRDKSEPTVQEKQRAALNLIHMVGRLERERRGEPVLQLHRDDDPQAA